ncbi:MAG: hypothetical protein INR73_28360 [Williamsia sp.]|nr:hypothetical protein [Williamsia sp.]
MKTQNNHKGAAAKAKSAGQHETANREQEVEKTSGKRAEHESPVPDADQHRSKDHTSKPQRDERDSM